MALKYRSLLFTVFILIITISTAYVSAKKLKAENAFCEKKSSAYYVNDNTNVYDSNATAATAVLRNISESRCLNYCTENHDAKGRLVLCATVVYDTLASTCTMYRKSSAPDGELTHRSDVNKRLFEKFCLEDDLPADCAGRQFVRVDEYILKGYAQATATFPTLAECAAHCVRESEFQCKSAMYFYEEGECITNSESAITQPDDFMRPDDDDKVIFIHNGCIEHVASNAANRQKSDGGALDNNSVKSSREKIIVAASNDDESPTIEEEEKEEKMSIKRMEQEVISTIPTTSTMATTTTTKPTTTMTTTTTKTIITTIAENRSISSLKNEEMNHVQKESLNQAEKEKQNVSQKEELIILANTNPSKYSKLMIKEKIYLIEPAQQLTDSQQPSTNLSDSAPIAPFFRNGVEKNKENDAHVSLQNVDHRLYGAQQLEKLPNGRFSFQEKNGGELVAQNGALRADIGPEHPPSGQIVVEDVVTSHANSMTQDAKSKENNNVAGSRLANSPPGIVPPQSGFTFDTTRQDNKKDIVEKATRREDSENFFNNKKSMATAPRAAMPIILMEELKKPSEKIEKKIFHQFDNTQTTTGDTISIESTTTQQQQQQQNDEINTRALVKQKMEMADQQQQPNEMHTLGIRPVSEIENNNNDNKNTRMHLTARRPVDEVKVEPTKHLHLKTLKTDLQIKEELELFSAWGEWTPCRAPGERRIRRRKCLDLRRCRGALMQVDYCTRDVPLTSQNNMPTADDSPLASSSQPNLGLNHQSNNKQSASSSTLATDDAPIGPPIRNPLPVNTNVDASNVSAGSPPSILPQKLPEKELKPLPDGAPGNPDDIWSPWLGGCQQFASVQPCKSGQMIGFESRECIAKDPIACRGPFFRYCTLSC